MCGRFFIEEREVFPSDWVPVLYGKDGARSCMEASFGFAGIPAVKGLIINARAETVRDKPMFRNHVEYRRCVIPASGYYEWDHQKVKHQFTDSEGAVLYLAGCYNCAADGDHFVVITTEANESVEQVHDRMPLVLKEDEVDMWLNDPEAYKLILKKRPEALTDREEPDEYEQISLF